MNILCNTKSFLGSFLPIQLSAVYIIFCYFTNTWRRVESFSTGHHCGVHAPTRKKEGVRERMGSTKFCPCALSVSRLGKSGLKCRMWVRHSCQYASFRFPGVTFSGSCRCHGSCCDFAADLSLRKVYLFTRAIERLLIVKVTEFYTCHVKVIAPFTASAVGWQVRLYASAFEPVGAPAPVFPYRYFSLPTFLLMFFSMFFSIYFC